MPEQPSADLTDRSGRQTSPEVTRAATDPAAESSHLEQLAVQRISDSFREKVLPAILTCKEFTLSAPHDDRAASLRELFQDPEHRRTTWTYVRAHGMPWNLTEGQRHALIATLAPYIAQDASCSWGAVFVLTAHCERTHDMEMYKFLGDTVRPLDIPKDILPLLSRCFLRCSTHQVSQEPAYTPWIELFLEKDDKRVFYLANEELRERVLKGDLSTYDHILTLMCRSQDQEIADVLYSSVSPPTPPSALPELPLPTALILMARQMITTLPIAAGVNLFLHGVHGVLSLKTVFAATLASAWITLTIHRKKFQEMVAQEVQEADECLRGPAYVYYADKVHEKLCEFLPSRPKVAETLDSMERNPAFSERHDAWKRRRSVVG